MPVLAAQDRLSHPDMEIFAHPSRENGILPRKGGLAFFQNCFSWNPFPDENRPEKLPLSLTIRRTACLFRAASGRQRRLKVSLQPAVFPAWTDERRVAFPVKLSGPLRCLRVIPARYKDDVCLLRLILLKDKLSNPVKIHPECSLCLLFPLSDTQRPGTSAVPGLTIMPFPLPAV